MQIVKQSCSQEVEVASGLLQLLLSVVLLAMNRRVRHLGVLTGGVVKSVRMISSGSWWHEEGDERSICGRSAYRSCILTQAL